MSKVQPAMEKTDFVSADDSQLLGFLKDLVMDFVSVGKAGIVGAGTALGGPIGFIAGLAISVLVDAVFEAAVDYAVEGIADLTAQPGAPEILEGSPNVFFNSKEAARGGPSGDNTTLKRIAQGSKWVDINKRPAARQGDRVKGSGKVVLDPARKPDIFIGGPPTTYDNELELNPDLKRLIALLRFANVARKLPEAVGKIATRLRLAKNAMNLGMTKYAAAYAADAGHEAYEAADKIWEKASGLGGAF
jgi:uncharacterized Zn-binding protein involved in type VI secretion